MFKNNTLVILLLLLFSQGAKSQQRYENQIVIGASGTFMPANGYGSSFFIEKYLGKSFSSLKLEGHYLDQKIPTEINNYKVGSSNYGVAFSYNYSLEKYIPSPFYINLGIGGVGGYQKIDYDDSMMEINAENEFVYGFVSGIQIEIIVYKSLSFYIEPKVYYFLTSDVRKMNPSLGAGFKIYL